MRVTKIEEYIYLIDVETAGIRNFIASYVLMGEKVALVETGPTSSVPNLLSALNKLKVKPEEVAYVALSHIHLDHGGGAGRLLRHLPNAKVIVHQRGASHLVNPEKLWQQSKTVLGKIAEIYGKPQPVPEERIIAAADGMIFNVGNGVGLRVVETIGHASHHLSYYETMSKGIFLGDAAGIYLNEIDVILPTTPPPFHLDVAIASLDKLINLKPKVLYYSHFGVASNAIEKLQTYLKQLKLWAKIVEQGIENKDNLKAIREEIVKNDAAFKKAITYIDTHPILSETALTESIKGFIDFAVKSRGPPK